MWQIRSLARARGRKFFQVRDISWSYRRRGKEARTQTKRLAKKRVRVERRGVERGAGGLKNRMEVSSLINRIIIYSAMKISAKAPALYSTLKPETSSDSPSAKSKGVRFVSARMEINQSAAKGGSRRAFGVNECISREKSKEKWKMRGQSMISAILTS